MQTLLRQPMTPQRSRLDLTNNTPNQEKQRFSELPRMNYIEPQQPTLRTFRKLAFNTEKR